MNRFTCRLKKQLAGILIGIILLSALVPLSGCSTGDGKKSSSNGDKGSSSTGNVRIDTGAGKNSGANDVLISRNLIFFYDGTDAFFVGMAGKELYTVPKEDGETFRVKVSLYGDKAIVCESYGKCYYFDGNAPVLIGEEVTDAIISPDGSSCAYSTYDEECNYYLYRYSNGASQLVLYEDVDNHYCDQVLLSFDGKYVGYSIIDDGSEHSYLWENDNSVIDLGRNYYILAVSTDADYLYYSTDALGERDFYIQCGVNSDKKVQVDHCGYNSDPNMYFNYDGTEMLIDAYSMPDKVYVKGEPYAKSIWSPYFLDQTIKLGNANFSAGIIMTNVKTLKNVITSSFYSPNISFIFISEDGEPEDFVKDAYRAGVRIFNGNREIICRMEDRIVKFTEKKGKVQQETLVSQNVNDLFVAEDGSRFFYREDSGALYYVEGSKKAKQIAETCDEWSYPISTPNDQVFDNKYLYFSIDGEMCVTDGSKTEKIDGVFGSLKELDVYSYFVLIITELDRVEHAFVSSDGLSFTQLE